MSVEVEGPDGTIYEFPDGTSPDVMRSAMAKRYGGSQAKPQGPMEQITGFMANVNRGLGIGDELAGAAQWGLNALQGKGGGLKGAMAQQRAAEDTYAQAHPNMAALGRGTGMAATAVVPGGPTTQIANASRLGNMARGATTALATGAAYSAADRGSASERLKAASSTATNPLVAALGAGAGALAPVAPRNTPQERLRAEGVSLTPGQRAGGIVKNAEDLAQRAPLVGPAIRGARERGVGTLNVAVGNRALAPIGETVPANVRAGRDLVAHVDERLGQVYDDAAAMVPQTVLDAPFATELQAISQRVRELPADVGPQFNNIINNRLAPLMNGPVSGAQLRDVQSQLRTMSGGLSSSQDQAQRALGEMLDDVATELGGVLGRSSPEAADLIQRADQGWANYVRLRNAGSRAKGEGIATPGQLAAAVRATDRSVGKGNVARGEALLQDITDAASQVMPDAFGNPGTADSQSMMALVAAIAAKPEIGIPAAGGLGAAAIPYLAMGRGAVRPGAGAPNAAQAAVQAQMAQRAAMAAGITGTPPTPRPPNSRALAEAIR